MRASPGNTFFHVHVDLKNAAGGVPSRFLDFGRGNAGQSIMFALLKEPLFRERGSGLDA